MDWRSPFTTGIAVLLAGTILASCNGPVAPSDPPPEPEPVQEWYTATWDSAFSVMFFDDSSTDGNHTVSIARVGVGGFADSLLRLAERVYPTRAMIEDWWFSDSLPPDVDTMADSSGVWWAARFDGTRLPFAVTARAVDYYWRLSEAFREGDFSETHGIIMSSSRLRYGAFCRVWRDFVTPDTTYAVVYVAELSLRWDQYCGPLCALTIWADRLVLFDAGGDFLRVLGDGEASIIVSH